VQELQHPAERNVRVLALWGDRVLPSEVLHGQHTYDEGT